MKIKEELSLEDINKLILQEEELELTPEIKKQIIQCYEFLENFSKEKVIYGINTGFGPMAQWKIEDKDLEQLQYNIILQSLYGCRKSITQYLCKSGSFIQNNDFY